MKYTFAIEVELENCSANTSTQMQCEAIADRVRDVLDDHHSSRSFSAKKQIKVRVTSGGREAVQTTEHANHTEGAGK